MSRAALVTGATGFIGWHLCERLRTSGWDVRAIVRPGTSRPVPPGVERVTAELTADGLSSIVRSNEVVFHVAGIMKAPNEKAFLSVNAGTTREVARAAGRAGARLVYVSSQAAAGPGTPETPRLEIDTPQPRCAYGVSKLAGETAVKEIDDLRWTILRPVVVYGPKDTSFLPLFRLARAGIFPLIGDRSASYMFIDIDDLVGGIERTGRSDTLVRETLFLSHPTPHTMDEVMSAFADAVGRPLRPFVVPLMALRCLARLGDLAAAAGRPGPFNRSRYREVTAGGYVCSVDRAQALLGFCARTDLPEGFARAAAWYRAHGLLRQPPAARTP